LDEWILDDYHNIVVSAMKKAADADMKQAMSTATREYDKK
jgi:hypothetical protein